MRVKLLGKLLFVMGLVYSSLFMLVTAMSHIFEQRAYIFEGGDIPVLTFISFVVMVFGACLMILIEKKDNK